MYVSISTVVRVTFFKSMQSSLVHEVIRVFVPCEQAWTCLCFFKLKPTCICALSAYLCPCGHRPSFADTEELVNSCWFAPIFTCPVNHWNSNSNQYMTH